MYLYYFRTTTAQRPKLKTKLYVLVALTLVSRLVGAADLPDPQRTPGVLNPTVTQQNIHQTVCIKGYTKTIRPPMYYTNQLKKEQIQEAGYSDTNPQHYEEDHLVPLSVGGHPTDRRNLWPQPRLSQWNADRKDELEYAIYQGVCHRELSLAEAQQAFASNWIQAYQKYGKLLNKYHHGSSRFSE